MKATEIYRKQDISNYLSPKRALIIYGPRRVGKTTEARAYLREKADTVHYYGIGDDIALRNLFASEDRTKLLSFFHGYELIIIDEAQMIPTIGLGIKMLIDAYPDKTIILTGSSSFAISQEVGEPLVGRHYEMMLFPPATDECGLNALEQQSHLEDWLQYGFYPEVLLASREEEKKRILAELVSSYMFKDILALEHIKKPDTLVRLTEALAFQVGSEVSLNELSRTVGIDTKTVARYLNLLERMFIVTRIRGFSRNLRNELTKKAKYYFLDVGLRNAVIGAHNPIARRDDVGALFENFVLQELLKRSARRTVPDKFYFWRTHTGQEVDIIRERDGQLLALEVKWKKTAQAPKLWRETYPDAEFISINAENVFAVLEQIG